MFDNSGYRAFAGALSDAGAAFGNALMERNRRQSLAELGEFARNQDYAGLSKAAFAMGDERLGLSALAMAQEQKDKQDRRALGAETLAPFIGGGTAQGGVTVNPNPQPMVLPGAVSGDASLPRGMRNFNPGNIEDGPFARSQPGYVGTDGRFAKFDTMEHGIGAQAGLLGKYGEKGVNTVSAIVNRYAPPSENGKATENYTRFVAGKLGVDPNAPLDLNNPQIRQSLALAMSQFENGRPVLGGSPAGVKVADASGAIPADVFQKPMQPTPVDALNQRKENLMRAIVSARAKGVDEQYVKSLEMLLEDTQSQITRTDKQTAQNKPEVKQFGDTLYSIGPDGIPKPLQKVEKSAQEKALTADQSNAAGFADRMDNAEKVLSNEKFAPFIMGKSGVLNEALGNVPMVGAKWQDAEFKQFQRAKKDFITAVLRKESGASIAASEFKSEDEKYFPQPWDDPQTIQDKADARKIAIASMRRAGGPAQPGAVGSSAASSEQPKPESIDHLARARKALADGIPREEVLRTLKSLNVDPSGL
jgi:hypothetical protein